MSSSSIAAAAFFGAISAPAKSKPVAAAKPKPSVPVAAAPAPAPKTYLPKLTYTPKSGFAKPVAYPTAEQVTAALAGKDLTAANVAAHCWTLWVQDPAEYKPTCCMARTKRTDRDPNWSLWVNVQYQCAKPVKQDGLCADCVGYKLKAADAPHPTWCGLITERPPHMGAFWEGTYCKELAKLEKMVYHAEGRPAPKPRRSKEEVAAERELKAMGGAGGPRKSGKKAEIEKKLAYLEWLIEGDWIVSTAEAEYEEFLGKALKPVDVEEAEKSEDEEKEEKEDD